MRARPRGARRLPRPTPPRSPGSRRLHENGDEKVANARVVLDHEHRAHAPPHADTRNAVRSGFLGPCSCTSTSGATRPPRPSSASTVSWPTAAASAAWRGAPGDPLPRARARPPWPRALGLGAALDDRAACGGPPRDARSRRRRARDGDRAQLRRPPDAGADRGGPRRPDRSCSIRSSGFRRRSCSSGPSRPRRPVVRERGRGACRASPAVAARARRI